VVIELVLLRVRHSVSDEAFLAAAASANDVLTRCRGFLRRRLAKEEHGQWVDYVEWETLPDALAAAEAFSADAAAQPFNAAIEPGSVTMRHCELRMGLG